jgi:hypothetical protein
MTTKNENDLFEIISSYSEPNHSETQGRTFESSEDDNSETSEDRAFVVSDGDQSPHSYGYSESFNCSQHCHSMDGDSSDLVSCMGTSFSVNKLTSPDWPENTDKRSYQSRCWPEGRFFCCTVSGIMAILGAENTTYEWHG